MLLLSQVNEQTTHLIGGKKGTAKYQEAQRLGTVKLVSIDWLWSCSERWEKVSEELFPIPKRKSNSTCSSREGTPPVSKSMFLWLHSKHLLKEIKPQCVLCITTELQLESMLVTLELTKIL